MLELLPRCGLTLALGDEAGVARDGFVFSLAKRRQNSARLQPLRSGSVADHCAVTAPGPVSRPARSHRVQHHIARQFQQIGIFLNEDRFVAPLKDMTDPLVGPIEPLLVDAVELAHAFGQIGIRRLDEQVVMVRHEAVRMHRPIETLPHVAEDVEKQPPVDISAIDVLAPITARGDVV